MPNVRGETKACEVAAATVARRLQLAGIDHRELTDAELARYPSGEFFGGWRLNVDISNVITALDLLVPTGFPWQPPRVALAHAPAPGTWPHVERDGRLCLAPNTVSINPDDPGGVSLSMLADACDLIGHILNGELEDDLRIEVLSYWDLRATHVRPTILSLIEARAPSRQLRLWRGKSRYILAEDDNAIRAWLTNLTGEAPASFRTETAALVWIGKALLPAEYPDSGADLVRIVRRAGASEDEIVRGLATETPDRLLTLLGFDTKNGPALTATLFSKPPVQKHGPRDPLNKGFRPGGVPPDLLLTRYFGGGTLARASVERADAAWIHGRGHDARQHTLRNATVVIIGCGSLGGPLAVMLAQAGVGRLVLVDSDGLSWANTGRHPLGATRVNTNKAKGLAEKLRADFPHMVVDYFATDADAFIRTQHSLLATSDLVIAATGSWAAETRLDAWHAENDRAVPIIYTWTEAHACAGHAVLVTSETSLRDGFTSTGVPLFAITDWPNGPTERSEPACGAIFQPYGPVELGFVTNIAAELALDSLVGKAIALPHRSWVGSLSCLREAGGVWSAIWRQEAQFREEGNFVISRPWPSAGTERAAAEVAA